MTITEAQSGVGGALAVGGSWGGLRACIRLLEGLPDPIRVPVFLVLHQRESLETRLAEVVQRHTALAAVSPDDKTPVEAGSLYVAPPGYHMLVNPDFTIGLTVYGYVHFSRPSIDETFFSVGHIYGNRSVGVLLTGANEDGAAGLSYMARRGGVSMVQAPGEAEAPVMPEAALATGRVHHVRNIDGLANLLRDRMVGDREQ